MPTRAGFLTLLRAPTFKRPVSPVETGRFVVVPRPVYSAPRFWYPDSMNRRAAVILFALSLFLPHARAAAPSATAAPENGPRRADPSWHALRNATIHQSPGHTLEHATLILRDGKIEAILPGSPDAPAQIPLGPRVWDCSGLHLYPGFIDPCVQIDVPRPDRNEPGAHWNSRVTPQRDAADAPLPDESLRKSLRAIGFTSAAVAPRAGIFRGTAAVESLRRDGESSASPRPSISSPRASHAVGFDLQPEDRDGSDWSGYPNSLMGAIALIRQTLLDTQYQTDRRAAGDPLPANCLDRLAPAAAPSLLVFEAQEDFDVLRVATIAREFKRPAAVLATGFEFQRLEAVRKDNLWLIEPLPFPRQPDVSTPGDQESTELRTMMRWEQAPSNLARLHAAGLRLCLTSSHLKDRREFLDNLRMAIKAGLPADAAFAMLTTRPAEFLGLTDRLGTLDVGKSADVLVADGELFAVSPPDPKSARAWKPAHIRDAWIEGWRHELEPPPAPDIAGIWDVTLGTDPSPRTLDIASAGELTVTKTWEDAASNKDHAQPRRSKAEKVLLDSNRLSFQFDHEALGDPGVFVMSATVQDGFMTGSGIRSDGRSFQWSASRRPPVLSGSWTIGYDANGLPLTTLSFDSKNQLQILDAAGASTTPGDLRFDGKILSFSLPAAGGAPARSAQATFDPSTSPRSFRGSIQTNDTRTTWSAVEDIPAGTWRILEHDGTKDDPAKPTGLWITIENAAVTLKFVRPSAEPNAAPATLVTTTVKATDVKIAGNSVIFTHELKPIGAEGISSDTITIRGNRLRGESTLPDASKHSYSGEREVKPDEYEDKDAWRLQNVPASSGLPFGPYALSSLPPRQNLIISHATLWTSSPRGTLPDSTLVVRDGTIAAILAAGEPLPAGVGGESWTLIDAAGKHISPGIIDCHSHTGISRGVNESGEAVTCEVRIQDVTNPDSISWYRQLAGGVTTVNSLHGSANAIGGQNCVNKIRWGCEHPDDMHFAGAIPGVKFALGENVKQSNMGRATSRYPSTRMGVEALIRDRFIAADEYRAALAAGKPVRRDLELEALAEVLDGKRLVHAHSYRQDEILMLANVARDFHFKIGTFQHILEGYKVADVIREHAIGASAFSDWWAYKTEVQDAIPQGPPLMAAQGVVVSYNSDSDEMARRLNAEAAKAMKYGGLSMEEALKFVTINPAIQLKIESKVGSLEVGKDADFVIWSGPPLSSLSRCEATYIEGASFFTLASDEAARQSITKERSRLIQKLLVGAKKKDPHAEPKPAPAKTDPKLRDFYAELVRQGQFPGASHPGDCGCNGDQR